MAKVKLVSGLGGGPARTWIVGPPLFEREYLFRPGEPVTVSDADYRLLLSDDPRLRGREFESVQAPRARKPRKLKGGDLGSRWDQPAEKDAGADAAGADD